MGHSKQHKVKIKQKVKRHKRRARLKEMGINPEDVFVHGKCLNWPGK